MAAIGDGWADGAFVEAGWASAAWSAVADQVAIGDGWVAGAWIENGSDSWIRASAPGGAWAVAAAGVAAQRIRGFTRNVGRLMNP